MMPAEVKKRQFFKNIPGLGKRVANIAGVQFVNEQSSVPQPDVATAQTVAKSAPSLGEVPTSGNVLDTARPFVPADAPMTPTNPPEVPAARPENNLGALPDVPAATPNSLVQPPSTPVPEAVQNAFASTPESTLNPTVTANAPAEAAAPSLDVPPTVVPVDRSAEEKPLEVQSVVSPEPLKTPESPVTPTVPEPVSTPQNSVVPSESVLSEAPVMNAPEPASEAQNTTIPAEPAPAPESPLVNTPEPEPAEPLVSNTAPEPSLTQPEVQKEEAQAVPHAFENAFKNESANHLDPAPNASHKPDSEIGQEGEFNVRINPIAEKLIKENPGKFIKVNAQGEPEFDGTAFDEAVFVAEVQANPKLETLLTALKNRGITLETALEVVKTYLK